MSGHGQEKAYGTKRKGLKENYTEHILLFSLHFGNVSQADFKSSQGSKIRHRMTQTAVFNSSLSLTLSTTQHSFSVEFTTVVTSKV